jgi:preprotein translocase subunit SecD
MAKIKDYLLDRRILTLIVIAVALLALDLHYGLHLGIEFIGGTQIPVTLQHGLNQSEFSGLLSTLDQRVSTFGLKQVTVEGIGNSEVYVVVPTVSSSEINDTISIIESQGRFDGIVNGKIAVNGSDILHSSIGALPPTSVNGSVSWAVSFFITQNAAENFAKVVLGQANMPLYMFLDRPSNTTILINASRLGNITSGLTASAALAAMKNALALDNNSIPVIAVYNNNASIQNAENFLSSKKGYYKTILASSNINPALLDYIRSNNYTLKLESKANMTPTYFNNGLNNTTLETWPLVGLLSSPLLNPSITNGSIGDSYEISGIAPLTLPQQQRLVYANNQSKNIASILSGGALPVGVIVGTPTQTSPTLGKGALDVSVLALTMASIFVSLFIVLRYRKAFLIAPIIMTTLMELFIIISIIGLIGTIDIAAVAGMIAVVGTGVDAQIIITDEVLNKEGTSGATKVLLGNAFYIVWADASLLIIAMMPLLFSTALVDIIGFSESTIIGALMGVLITRPAYGAIVGKHYAEAGS